MPVRDHIETILSAIPLHALRRAVPRELVSVVYHVVSERPVPWVENLYPCKTPEQFEADLEYLKSRWHPVSHEDVVEHVAGRRRLPPHAVEVTFDDGFSECHSIVRPILLRHGVPCSFFVITGVVDGSALMFRNKASLCFGALAERAEGAVESFNRRFGLGARDPADLRRWIDDLRHDQTAEMDGACELLGIDLGALLANERPYMSRDQIADLHRDGFAIGAHTVNHPRLWLMRDFADVTREIVDSCSAVCRITRRNSAPVAFPFNGRRLPRGQLGRLRRENPCVGLMYDTNNVARDPAAFVVNRVPADLPPPRGSGRTGVERSVKRALALHPFKAMTGRERPPSG